MLGDEEYLVVAQRHARLRRELGKLFQNLGDLGDLEIDSANSMLDLVGDKVYDLLAIFIPDLMPKYEFMGYATSEAMEADRYDEEADRSPTQPQIREAIERCLDVNGFDWIGKVKDFIGSDFLRAQLRVRLAEWATSTPTTSTSLPNSPSTNGGSAPTTTGPSEPTSEDETTTSDSPSPVSLV